MAFAMPRHALHHAAACGGKRAAAPVRRVNDRASSVVPSAAKIIDGKKIAEDIRGEIAAEVADLKARTGKVKLVHGEVGHVFSRKCLQWHPSCACADYSIVQSCMSTGGPRMAILTPDVCPSTTSWLVSRHRRLHLSTVVSQTFAAFLPCLVQSSAWLEQVPGLAVVIVGSRPDSMTYVRSKKKSAVECGFNSVGTELPETASEEEVLKVGGWAGRCTYVRKALRVAKDPRLCAQTLHAISF
jgi:hypothetical protein